VLLNESTTSATVVSLTEKKLNNYLNQANFIMHKSHQKSELPSTNNTALGSSYATRDLIQTPSHKDEGDSCKNAMNTSGNSSMAIFSTNSTKKQKTKAGLPQNSVQGVKRNGNSKVEKKGPETLKKSAAGGKKQNKIEGSDQE
jgi:hypothetical protein